MPNTTQNQKFEQAIHFATNCHSGQMRKGSTTPYIMHPLEVMMILQKMNADTNLLIAGLFHDIVEDTDTGIDEIREQFGEDVAMLVEGHSEDKRRTWQERKQSEIDETMAADLRMKKLVLADKLANMRSIQKDLGEIGEKLWERFKAGKDEQAWYYGQMIEALAELEEVPEVTDLYNELRKTYNEVFWFSQFDFLDFGLPIESGSSEGKKTMTRLRRYCELLGKKYGDLTEEELEKYRRMV